MSFWNILGLASAADIQALQEELRTVREENAQLHDQAAEKSATARQEYAEELRRAVQELSQKTDELKTEWAKGMAAVHEERLAVQSSVDCVKEELSRGLLESSAQQRTTGEQVIQKVQMTSGQISELKEQLEAMEGRLPDFAANHWKILETVAQVNSRGEEMYSELQESLGNAERRLQETIRQTVPQKQLECLREDQTQTLELLAQAQTTLGAIPEMKDYLSMLWEATKLVWVNELLDALEKNN